MILFLLSFVAGALTVLAPCILPLLPVVIAGSADEAKERKTPFIIIASLSASIIIFTFILKVSTAFVTVPSYVWGEVSGGILVAFGLVTMFPRVWEKVSGKISFGRKANALLANGYRKKSATGDVLVGFALGPIFSTCSPTYAVILASVLPQSFIAGFADLLAYVTGLSVMLFAIALLGQRFVSGAAFASDPNGWFKRTLGVVFFTLGLIVFFGIDKQIETSLVSRTGGFDVTRVESALLSHFKVNE